MRSVRNKVAGEDKAEATTKAVIYDQPRILGLVVRAIGGDFEAFGELYSVYLDRIYRYIFYLVKDRMTAEDITEEAFFKAWKERTFSSWLYRIAHNHVIDNLRSRGKYLSLDMEIIGKVSDPELEVEGALEQQELLGVIDCLPQNQRQVIILKFIEGLDNSEIEQVMGKSQGAIRVLQMRALAALRQELSREK